MIYIGYVAAFLTTISFLPQAIKTWSSKNTKSISLPMYFILNVGLLCWLVYGLVTKDILVIVGNFVTFVFAFPILILKIKYK